MPVSGDAVEGGGGGAGVEHSVERGAADAEAFGGADLVACAAEKDIEDMILNDIVKTFYVALDARVGDGAGEFAERREMHGFDDSVHGIACVLAGEFDDTLKLANVSRPIMALKA